MCPEKWALNPEELGGRGGGAEALLGSLDRVWDPEESGDFLIRSVDRGWNPEVSVIGPEGRMRVQGCSLDPEIVSRPWCTWTLRSHGNPKIGGSHKDPEFLENPECFVFAGTVLHLPRQDYYRYLFGFSILPLGSWPLSSSYVVFYFCRKSLTCLDGAGVGVMTQVPSLRCFPLLEKQDLDCVGVENGYDKVNVQISAKISMSIFYESDSS
ncbi:hypothetical protein F2Q69_00042173 [Brassica cretica]|uniref:Uncharacterized protein n=1 Tax=Brassica cretica TaxID=69181 RepID=A0A8S9N9N6_BRACR|nr:hypothetical protein F2Q69_00042173 [Brassica cretica]